MEPCLALIAVSEDRREKTAGGHPRPHSGPEREKEVQRQGLLDALSGPHSGPRRERKRCRVRGYEMLQPKLHSRPRREKE